MSGKLKTVFYEQQNYFEKMMGIMLEWHHINRNANNLTLNFRNIYYDLLIGDKKYY